MLASDENEKTAKKLTRSPRRSSRNKLQPLPLASRDENVSPTSDHNNNNNTGRAWRRRAGRGGPRRVDAWPSGRGFSGPLGRGNTRDDRPKSRRKKNTAVELFTAVRGDPDHHFERARGVEVHSPPPPPPTRSDGGPKTPERARCLRQKPYRSTADYSP